MQISLKEVSGQRGHQTAADFPGESGIFPGINRDYGIWHVGQTRLLTHANGTVLERKLCKISSVQGFIQK